MNKELDNVNQRSAETADEVFESVHALMHLLRTRQFRALRDGPHDLTHMESKALSFFDRHPGATQSELVAHSVRDKGQMGRLIGTLRNRGLIEARVDEADRRVQHIYLTAEGRRVHASVQRQRLRVAKLAVSGLNEEERRLLVELLRRARSSLEAAQ